MARRPSTLRHLLDTSPQPTRSLTTSPHTPLTFTNPSEYIRPYFRLPSSAASSSSSRRLPPTTLPEDFRLYPSFFSRHECRILLKAALWKLDRADPVRRRVRKPKAPDPVEEGTLQDLFIGPYGFQDAHFDSVIHEYRETLLTNLPPSPSPSSSSTPALSDLLSRLYDLLPNAPKSIAHGTTPPGTSTHLLHLSPKGRIDRHVDNLEASGSVIVGVSLGAKRILRLERKVDEGDQGRPEEGEGWEVLLPSGSVYVQKDSVRYQYEHSILGYEDGGEWDGKKLEPGHRISIMVRDAHQSSGIS